MDVVVVNVPVVINPIHGSDESTLYCIKAKLLLHNT